MTRTPKRKSAKRRAAKEASRPDPVGEEREEELENGDDDDFEEIGENGEEADADQPEQIADQPEPEPEPELEEETATVTPFVVDMNHANIIAWPFPRGEELAGMLKIKEQGIIGIIHKARQGITFVDNLFKHRRDNALKVDLKVGSYDFATGAPVAENVKEYLDFVGIDRDLSYWLDFEDNTHSEMSLAQALEFLDRVSQVIGRPCGLYTGNRFKDCAIDEHQRGAITDAQYEQFAKYPLWLAEFGPEAELIDPNKHPLPWTSWFLWQYTDSRFGPKPRHLEGLGKGCDLSTFNGSADRLHQMWSLAT